MNAAKTHVSSHTGRDAVLSGSMANTRLRTMQAGVISAPRRIDIMDVPIPEPNSNQVLVRLEGCGVCASNIPLWEGRPWFTYPMGAGAPGHEGWGRVAKIGHQVTEFSLGDRVAVLSHNAYAEYDLSDQLSTVKLPAGLDQQPFPAEPFGCAMNIFRRSQINRDDTVAVVGVGFLGALLIQLVHAVGARVLAISRREAGRRCALDSGASHVLILDEQAHVVSEIKDLTDRRLCDVVIECTGKQGALDLAAELTRERGRLVIAGYHQDGLRQINMQLWNWRGLDVINAHERDPQVYCEGMHQAVRAVQTGLLNPAPLFTHTFPLHQLGDALEIAAARPAGFMKALVLMQ